MKKNILSILILIITTNAIFCQKSENLNKSKNTRVIEAYGFIVGQEYTLNKIVKDYPHLKADVLIVQMNFNQIFSKSKIGLENYIKYSSGKEDLSEIDSKIISAINNVYNEQKFTEEIAIEFISEVENRAKGNIISTVLETLLYFQFIDRPQDEFTTGFTNKFKTKGHPKSKNTDWQIKVPKSWKAEEGERPNIIQKFTSDYGSGNQSVALMVKELTLPKGTKLTKDEINLFFTEEEMKKMSPAGSEFISFTKMTIDKNVGGMLEIEQTAERLDIKMKIRLVQFMFIKDNKWYFLQCSVGTSKLDSDLSIELKKYLPLFKLVANSIVVNDQY
jgi:hypothetical protein